LGSAFAQKYRGVDDISVAVIGDGSLDEGISYELLNLAALHRLPLLIICENNRYAAHTPVEQRMSSPFLAKHAQAFGLETANLDGNDPVLLLGHLQTIVSRLRSGSGPVFVEIETYRLCAHVGPGDDLGLGYRTVEEIDRWKLRDPVVRMRQVLADTPIAADLTGMESDIETSIRSAIAAAKAADFHNFSEVVAMNWSGEYSTKIGAFVGDALHAFEGGQSETRLLPF
jgi:pyruvate dehydrogenase E1 component alpha subunit